MKILIGRKIGMTTVFDKEGHPQAATVLLAGPCYVTQIRQVEKEGYTAVQLGFGEAREKLLSKMERGHLRKAGVKVPLRHLVEYRVSGQPNISTGSVLDVDQFHPGDRVTVSGISKGKGFQGIIKRFGARRFPKTHGHPHERKRGSIGGGWPQRVLPGTKMAGRMGRERVTVKNLTVLSVEPENHLLYLSGAVPGPKKGIVEIRSSL